MENEVNKQDVVKQETVTKSLRLTKDRAEEYEEVKEVFSNANEFADWIVSAYRLHKSKQSSDLFKQDTDNIMTMFESVFGVISGVVARAEDMVKAKDIAITEELRARDNIADNLKEDVKALEEVITQKDTEIKAQKDITKDIQLQLKEQTEILEQLKKDYKTTSDLNSELMEKKEHYKALDKRNKELLEDVLALRQTLKESEIRANENELKVAELQKEIISIQDNHKDKLNSIEAAHIQKIKHLESMKELELSNGKLEVQAQAQAKIDALRDKLDNLKETHEKEISELNNQVSQLTKELSELKAAHEKASESNKKISKVKAKEIGVEQ